jgi:mRNA-degrading endonuclease RelE of RelBE toxin-antitoxin system
MWAVDRKNQFKRQYKHLHPEIQKRVDNALTILVNEQNPAKPEYHKVGNFTSAFAAKIQGDLCKLEHFKGIKIVSSSQMLKILKNL